MRRRWLRPPSYLYSGRFWVLFPIWVALLAVVVVILAGCTSVSGPTTVLTGTASSSPSPSPTGPVAVEWPAPSDRLTPGAIQPGCTYPRPPEQRNVTAGTKHRVKIAYHYNGQSGIWYVEYDHRVPYSLCGADDGACPKTARRCRAAEANIWPEPYDGAKRARYTWNFKDTLERVIASRVRNHKMTLEQGQQVFLGDWRLAWCAYVYPDPSNPGVTC